jgi:hypothetical protein
MATHDWMLSMHFIERLAMILNLSAKETGGQLILQFFQSVFGDMTEEKTDHTILKNPIDEIVDNLPQNGLAAELLEISTRSDRTAFGGIVLLVNHRKSQRAFSESGE